MQPQDPHGSPDQEGGQYPQGSQYPHSYGADPYRTQAYGANPYASSPFAANPYATSPYATDPYATGPYAGMPYGAPAPPAPPTPPAAPRRTRRTALTVAAAVAFAALVGGTGYAVGHNQTTSGVGSSQAATGNGSAGSGNTGPFGNGTGNGSSGSTGTASTTTATAAQQVGVVDIDTVLGYQQARAAGTGLVLTSGGEILTNNHVVDGATAISVTVVSTGKTYSGKVVGTAPTQDVAVIQLSGASGLATAQLGDSSSLHTGATVTGVGNAGGGGGVPSAATGVITALNQQLTASDTNGQNSEKLTGMIQTNAPIAAGDSGGPLYNTSNQVIGMDTAAATNGRSTVAGYAIPISHAVSVAQQIETGVASATIHIGYPGFMGVSVADGSNGALIEGVVANGPAARAGIAAGDVVTAVNGHSVTSASSLKSTLSGAKPGQQVTVTWTDPAGSSHSATVTLITGPAD
jgi:S1-C subfamily serine protease